MSRGAKARTGQSEAAGEPAKGVTSMHGQQDGTRATQPRQRAAVRIEHWIGHNENHLRAYEEFAGELVAQNANACANEIRALVELTRQSTDRLRRALAALG